MLHMHRIMVNNKYGAVKDSIEHLISNLSEYIESINVQFGKADQKKVDALIVDSVSKMAPSLLEVIKPIICYQGLNDIKCTFDISSKTLSISFKAGKSNWNPVESFIFDDKTDNPIPASTTHRYRWFASIIEEDFFPLQPVKYPDNENLIFINAMYIYEKLSGNFTGIENFFSNSVKPLFDQLAYISGTRPVQTAITWKIYDMVMTAMKADPHANYPDSTEEQISAQYEIDKDIWDDVWKNIHNTDDKF